MGKIRDPFHIAISPEIPVVTSEPIRVRDAEVADAESMLRIYGPMVAETAISFETEVPTIAEFSKRIANSRERYAWLVAEAGDDLVGYAYATPHRPRAAYRFSVETSVYVDPAHRGRRIGSRLYRALFPILLERGYYNAYAGITLPNDASVALHRSMGFEPVGVFRSVGFKFGAWHDVSWWHMVLNASAPRGEPR